MSAIAKAKAAARTIASPIFEISERRLKAPLYTAEHSNLDLALHVFEAAQWLKRAQDHGSDRGVSYGSDFGKGFLPSYPETTGYIIPTFLHFAEHFGDDNYNCRALEMGEWEAEIQMSSGAVMGGMYSTTPTPAVFNTGMVLLGWADLFRHTKSNAFAAAGKRAAQWLIELQEPDGSWVRCNSRFANSSATVYNVKAAWGLAEMGHALEEERYIAAAVRNAEYAVSKQLDNGWFSDCCLDDPTHPLLHTLGYAMQGLIGIGTVTERRDFIDAAARTAKSLITLMEPTGFIPGKIARDFTGAADWCCLTGTAQTSVVWSQLGALTNDEHYAQPVAKANDYLMARHDVSSPDPSIRGGLAGSWPVWAPYGKYRVLNWATKFLADALMAVLKRNAKLAT